MIDLLKICGIYLVVLGIDALRWKLDERALMRKIEKEMK